MPDVSWNTADAMKTEMPGRSVSHGKQRVLTRAVEHLRFSLVRHSNAPYK